VVRVARSTVSLVRWVFVGTGGGTCLFVLWERPFWGWLCGGEQGMCCAVVGWLLMRELEMFGGDVGHVSAPRRCQILKR
jgi:hypothetical protein